MAQNRTGIYIYKGLRGYRGMLAAVIALSVADLHRPQHRNDALQYFNSANYKKHLEYLGLPIDLVPDELAQ